MAKDEYDPEIQSVIDRFIAGEIPLTTKAQQTPDRKPKMPVKSQADWANSHEEGAEMARNRRARDGNYYERLSNRGLNRTGDS